MKRIMLACLVLISSYAPPVKGQRYFKYWIEFTDKGNTPYSVDHPEDYLSGRAIQRRANHGIPIGVNDLPVDPAYVAGIEAIGGRAIHTSRWFNAMLYETTDSFEVDEIAAKAFVKNIHAMYWGGFSYFTPPYPVKKSASEEYYDYGWGTNQIHLHHGERLHNEGYRGAGMIIAVLDAGFFNVDSLPAFDSLRENNRIILTRDFVHKGNNVFREHTHGMSVLSLMGGKIPGSLVGTAPEAQYMLLRSEDVRTEWRVEEINWIAAAEFADSAGADVINTSLGYSDFQENVQDYTPEDMDGNTTWVTRAADLAASKGILVVSSAGNSGNKPWKYITSPADGDSVLAVGAVDSTGTYAPFSSQGPSADGRIKPNVMAQGSLAWVQLPDGKIARGSGTSFASPIMAGLAACLWQRFPEKTNYEIIKILEQSATKYPYPDNKYGYGIPNLGVAIDIITGHPGGQDPAGACIFPNPAEDRIFLMIPDGAGPILNVRVVDPAGRVIQFIPGSSLNGENPRAVTLGSQVTPGLYIARITTENVSITTRFIRK